MFAANARGSRREVLMSRSIELNSLDLRYESYRMRDAAQEARLLGSIAERGIEEPLEGVDAAAGPILLNGFKRRRCARKLHLGQVPYESLAEEEACGIVQLLRTANHKGLSILEQARFIDELRSRHQMSVAQMAEELSRSKGWVSVRLGLIAQMSDKIREKLFAGAFPVYAYMYTLRQFMRINAVSVEDVEEFVLALSGKNLSVRQIEYLADGFFRGSDEFREQIRAGHLAVPLEQMNRARDLAEGCSPFESRLLKDLQIVDKYMRRVMGKSASRRLKSKAFFAQGELLLGGLLSRTGIFTRSLRQLHDRVAKT